MAETKQRVSDEQSRAAILCYINDDCPKDCPYYGLDKCEYIDASINITVFAADLLDARKERDEARAMLLAVRDEVGELLLITKDSGAAGVCLNILEQTKEYTE